MLSEIFHWIGQHWVELIATITGLIYIYLSVKENVWLWVAGFFSSALYVYVYYKAKFYADMSMQFYYLAISVYGLYYWLFGGKKNLSDPNAEKVPIQTTSLKLGIILFAVFVILWIILGFVLKDYTDSPVPWGDAFTTAGSIVATWMLARKYIEQWLIWIVVDSVSLGLYIYKHLYPTSFLFLVYTILAVVGYLQWHKTLQEQKLAVVHEK